MPGPVVTAPAAEAEHQEIREVLVVRVARVAHLQTVGRGVKAAKVQ
jgi:hypothetical protein